MTTEQDVMTEQILSGVEQAAKTQHKDTTNQLEPKEQAKQHNSWNTRMWRQNKQHNGRLKADSSEWKDSLFQVTQL